MEFRLPRLYLHCLAFAVMSAAFFLTLAAHRGLGYLDDAWGMVGMVGVAWFPSACVEVFLRSGVERVIWPTVILSGMLGWDAAYRCG